MTHDFVAEVKTFWITHGPEIETGELEAGQRMTTGRPYFETYSSPRRRAERLSALRDDYARALTEWLEVLRLRDPLAHLADYRWRKETGGVTCSNGAELYTTRESQSQMTSTLVALAEELIPSPVPWKAQNGWYMMDLAAMRTASTEVAAHNRKCFAAEETVIAQLADDPTLDVEAAFDAAYGGL
jgi:hypothetical protein